MIGHGDSELIENYGLESMPDHQRTLVHEACDKVNSMYHLEILEVGELDL